MGSSKSWRPDKWDDVKETIRLKAHEEDWEREDIFEAGADAMHKADVEWIKEHIIITEGVFGKEEWEEFIGEEAKE